MDQAAIITASALEKMAVDKKREEGTTYCYENPFALALQRATEELLEKQQVQQDS